MLLKVSKKSNHNAIPTFYSPEDAFNPTVSKFTEPDEWMRQVEKEILRLVDVDRRRQREREVKEQADKKAKQEAKEAYARRSRERREQQRQEDEREKQRATQEEADERRRREQREWRQQKEKGKRQQKEEEHQPKSNKEPDQSKAEVAEKAKVLSCWKAYTSKWTKVQKAALESASFSSIPWPIATGQGIRVVGSLTKQAISSFILSPHHSVESSPKKRLRQALLLYHPDRFMTKIMPRVRVSERDKVQTAQRTVVLILNDLLEAQS